MLVIVASYHCMQFQGKLTNDTWKNKKKPLVLVPILAHSTQIQAANIFFFLVKILALSVTRCHGQLLSCTIPEKTNDPILKKLRDGQTEGYTDEQTEGQTHRQTRVSS